MNYIRKSRRLIHVAEDSCCKKLEGCILGKLLNTLNDDSIERHSILAVLFYVGICFWGCRLTLAVRFFAWWKVPILAHDIHGISFVRSCIITISAIYYWEKVGKKFCSRSFLVKGLNVPVWDDAGFTNIKFK